MNILIPFIGGLGMFIYGMQIMAQGLENAAGNKMKKLLEVLTKNKFMGVLLGALITAVIQSSSATTVMVVGFVNAGIMNLQQAMCIIMGANIGTTVTGWLVSSVEWAQYLSPVTLAPIAIMIGVIIMLTQKRYATKELSNIIIGFGLLFVGITTMSGAVEPLKDSEAFCNLFVVLGKNPLLGILAGALVTAIIQSSSASVGILQSLAAAGLVPFHAAIYIIMGQNIGTCITAIISGLGANKNAKTAGLMHLLFNIIGTTIFSIVAISYISIVQPSWAYGIISQTEISLVHTIFNIATTVLLFPVSDWIIKIASKLGHVSEEDTDKHEVLLDVRMLETPSIAIQSVAVELDRMMNVVNENLSITKDLMAQPELEKVQHIKNAEKQVNQMVEGLSNYIMEISALQISEKEHQEVVYMLQGISDLERISDHCENIAETIEHLTKKHIHFIDDVKDNLQNMGNVCMDCFQFSIQAFKENNHECMISTIEKETLVDDLERMYRKDNVKNMTKQMYGTQEGVAFQDILINLERISDHARNIAEIKCKVDL